MTSQRGSNVDLLADLRRRLAEHDWSIRDLVAGVGAIAIVGAIGSFIGRWFWVLPSSSFGTVGEWVSGAAAVAALVGVAHELRASERMHEESTRKQDLADFRTSLERLQEEIAEIQGLFNESDENGLALLCERSDLQSAGTRLEAAFNRCVADAEGLTTTGELVRAHTLVVVLLRKDPPGEGLGASLDSLSATVGRSIREAIASSRNLGVNTEHGRAGE